MKPLFRSGGKSVLWQQVIRDVGAAVEDDGVLGMVQKLFKR